MLCEKNDLKLVLKSINHIVFDGKGFAYEDVKNEDVVTTLKRYGSEKLDGDTSNHRGMETLEYLIFDVYFTDATKPYLIEYMEELTKSIAYCGYGVVNGLDSYNKALRDGLNHFELELNNTPEYLFGEVENIFNKVNKVYLAKEGVTYNIVAMPSDGAIWRDSGVNCEGYCKVMYSELLDRKSLMSDSVLDNFVILNGFTLLSNCVGKGFVGKKFIAGDIEITYRNFKDMLFANIVDGGLEVE